MVFPNRAAAFSNRAHMGLWQANRAQIKPNRAARPVYKAHIEQTHSYPLLSETYQTEQHPDSRRTAALHPGIHRLIYLDFYHSHRASILTGCGSFNLFRRCCIVYRQHWPGFRHSGTGRKFCTPTPGRQMAFVLVHAGGTTGNLYCDYTSGPRVLETIVSV